MKKKLFLAMMLVPLIGACNLSQTYYPSNSYPGPEEGESTPGGEGEDEELEFNMTVNFYLDYSHSEENEVIYTMRWYMLKPLGSIPEGAILTDANAQDELYPHFLGYSEYSSSIDEDKLWNFETDYKQSNILNLYGIWVSN